MQLPLSGAALLQVLPQRAPMLLVDALIGYTEDTAVAEFHVKAGFLFEDQGELVESGLLEHMAQSVALHTGYTFLLKGEPAPTGYIGSMQQVSIFRLPQVQECLRSEVTIVQEYLGVTLVQVKTLVDGIIIAEAAIKTVIAQH